MRTRTKQQIKATEGTHYRIEPYDSRAFALFDERDETLVGVFVYLRGAAYVARKFAKLEKAIIAGVKACDEGAG
jgi:hypothetical protein